MTFEEYQSGGRGLYLSLVNVIQNILQQALEQHNLVAHAIGGRAKEVSSLQKKLSDREIPLGDDITQIKDLAGCRIVFLTNSQVDIFNNTGALHDNFEILNVNVHHPVPGTATEANLFDSTNYLVRLKSDRLALPEYRQFEGLQAEIQIQTLLNHAWAEMGHDTIYKEPKLTHLGSARMTAIGERMSKVMQDHLIPAGHDFDKIARDFRLLVKADLAAGSTLEAIEHADNNNVLENALETFTDLILPHFDDPAEEFSKRLNTLVNAMERSRHYEAVAITTEYGDYPGKTSLDVARRIAQLVRSYRYFEPERTVRSIIRLYLGARDDDERQIWIEAGEKLAEHNLVIWKQYGPAAQKVIIEELEKSDSADTKGARELFVAMLAHVLSADLGGTTWRFDSVTIHQGAVRASEELRRLRGRAIEWLENWLDEAESDRERLTILQALGKVDTLPMQGEGNHELMLMLFEDSARVAQMILERAPQWSLELRRNREVDALHTHYRFHVLRADLASCSELVEAQRKLINALIALRDQLASDAEFVRYKTLIGYDSVRPNAWDGDHFDFEARDNWRRDQYPSIIEEVTLENVLEWRARIDSYVDAVGSDGGHFTSIRDFLRLLAQTKPDVALRLIDNVSDRWESFLSAILAGLERAGRQVEIHQLVDQLMAEGQFLQAIGNYFQSCAEPDLGRLYTFVAKAIELGSPVSAVSAVTIAAKWYQRAPQPILIDRVLMPVIRFVSEHGHPNWTGQFFPPPKALILEGLNEPQASELLQSFVHISKVDYHDIRLMAAVGKQHPQLVIKFFGDRIRLARTKSLRNFDPVPFHSHDLQKILSPHPDLMLLAVRQWYYEEARSHEYRGARLLKHAFPELTDAITEPLIELIQQGDERDFKFVLKTLSPYEGAKEIYPVLMVLVEQLEPNDQLLETVSDILDETGVISGEFGFVEIYTRRKELIEQYFDDPRSRVRTFARNRARELAQNMAWEQRRAARDLAQRKRDWNEA